MKMSMHVFRIHPFVFTLVLFCHTNLRGEWCKQINWICWYVLSIVRPSWWCKELFHLPKHRRYKEIIRSQPLRAWSWCSFYFSKTLNLNQGQGSLSINSMIHLNARGSMQLKRKKSWENKAHHNPRQSQSYYIKNLKKKGAR